MIVVDTNIIAALYLPSDLTAHAEALLQKEPQWVAPVLWRSEFRNVLAMYLRKKMLAFDEAYRIQSEAESLLNQNEYEMASFEVLQLAQTSGCSAYDCEFVALAKRLNAPLFTQDKQILTAFPDIAATLT